MENIILIFLSSLITLFIGFIIGYFRRESNSNVGEEILRKLVLSNLNDSNYHLMNNVTLPTEKGTTQIDHVIISKYGIFIIETKHLSGWIFGDQSAQNWTQVLFKFKVKFLNPIIQNKIHFNTVKKLLDFIPKENFHSIVVFTGNAVFKTNIPNGVCLIDNFIEEISKFNEEVLSSNRMQFCVGRIEVSRKLISKRTDVEHVNYVQERSARRFFNRK